MPHTLNAEGSAALAGPPWLRDRRAAGVAALASAPMPSESEEVWRYTPIDELKLEEFAPVMVSPGALPADGTRFRDLVLSTIGPVSAEAVVHNGYPLSFRTNDAESGLVIGGCSDSASGSEMVGGVQVGGDALVLLNDAFMP